MENVVFEQAEVFMCSSWVIFVWAIEVMMGLRVETGVAALWLFVLLLVAIEK